MELKHKYSTGCIHPWHVTISMREKKNIWHLATQRDKAIGSGQQCDKPWAQLPAERQPCATAGLQQEQTTRANHFQTLTERYLHGYRKPVTSLGSGWLQTYLRHFKLPPEVFPHELSASNSCREVIWCSCTHIPGQTWRGTGNSCAGRKQGGWHKAGWPWGWHHPLPQTFLLQSTPGISNGNGNTAVL